VDKVDYKSIDYTPVKIGVIATVAFIGLFYELGLVFVLAVIAGLLVAILSCELMKYAAEDKEESKTEA
jgi:zinc transporter ZupT